MLDTAQQEQVATLYRDWQIPMYNFEFSLIPVTTVFGAMSAKQTSRTARSDALNYGRSRPKRGTRNCMTN
jgi:hypothetical protein